MLLQQMFGAETRIELTISLTCIHPSDPGMGFL